NGPGLHGGRSASGAGLVVTLEQPVVLDDVARSGRKNVPARSKPATSVWAEGVRKRCIGGAHVTSHHARVDVLFIGRVRRRIHRASRSEPCALKPAPETFANSENRVRPWAYEAYRWLRASPWVSRAA